MQRLGPPHWPAYPAGAVYGRLYARDPALGLRAARLGARLIAADLAAVGITVDCLPLGRRARRGRRPGDRRSRLWRYPGPGVGDRRGGRRGPRERRRAAGASSTCPATAAPPPTATSGCRSSMPTARPWKRRILPRSSRSPRLPLGMTAHVVFTAFDPGLPATTSAVIIHEVIRVLDRVRWSVDE